jgi:hypothetical protein
MQLVQCCIVVVVALHSTIVVRADLDGVKIVFVAQDVPLDFLQVSERTKK